MSDLTVTGLASVTLGPDGRGAANAPGRMLPPPHTLAGVTGGDVTVTAPRYTPGSPRTKSLWMNEIRPK